MKAMKVTKGYGDDGTYKYRGFDITVEPDEDSEYPDAWGDDERYIVSDHRDFSVRSGCIDDIRNVIGKTKRLFYNGYYVFPVDIYIHSGIALSLSGFSQGYGGWDTSSGWCFILIKRVRGCWSRTSAYKAAYSLLKCWNMYLSGDVHACYADKAGYFVGGWYGTDGIEEAISEAEDAIDNYIINNCKKHIRKIKQQIKNHAPLSERKEWEYGKKNIV